MRKRIAVITVFMTAAFSALPDLSCELASLRAELLSQQQHLERLQLRIEELSAEQAATAKEMEKTKLVQSPALNIKDVEIYGWVQGQFGYSRVSNDDGNHDYSTFEMRRVRVGVRGALPEDFHFQVGINPLPDRVSMGTSYIEWRKYRPAYIRMGYNKPRFGFDENTSVTEMLAVERTLITSTLAPGYSTGLSMSGTKGRLSYNAGVYNDQRHVNADENEKNRYLLNLSTEVKLDDLTEEGRLRFRSDFLRSDDRDGNFGADFREALSLSSHYAAGNGFDFRAEYLFGRGIGGDNVVGGYVMPSQYITEKLQAVVRLETARSDAKDGLSAPARYMRRTVDRLPAGVPDENADRKGDGYNALYLGLNFYMADRNSYLMMGVELAELLNTPKGRLAGKTLYTGWRVRF